MTPLELPDMLTSHKYGMKCKKKCLGQELGQFILFVGYIIQHHTSRGSPSLMSWLEYVTLALNRFRLI